MKRILSLTLVLALIMVLIPAAYAQTSEKQRVLVVFKEKIDKTTIGVAKGKIKHEFKSIPIVSAEVPAYEVKRLKKNPDVAAVEVDTKVKIQAQTQDWGILQVKAPRAWSSKYTGKGIKIAVIDTGIALHDDLAVKGGVSFVSYTNSYSDDNGHGTHVAGIIGARNNSIGTVGVAPDSHLYSVKVLDKDGTGYMSDIISGIDWSITNKMDIVNLSMGSRTNSYVLEKVVNKAYSEGILVVAAAGNDGTYDGAGDNVNYPAKYDSAIAVAAANTINKRASFSSTGNTVEVAAPGVNVVSTYLNNEYVYMSGTSMAAPYVSGNLALLKQAYPVLTNVELREKLKRTALDLGSAGRDTWFGYGLIQAPLQQTISIPTSNRSQTYETRTVLSTDKLTYSGGNKVHVKAKVTDSYGRVLSGAQVMFTIIKSSVTYPNVKIIIIRGKTNPQGQVDFTLSAKDTASEGTYSIIAQTTCSGYKASSAKTLFRII